MHTTENSSYTDSTPPSFSSSTPAEQESRESDAQSPKAQDRSNRIYSNEDLWYFRTREGKDVGPFRYRSEAESNLNNFLQHLKERLR